MRLKDLLTSVRSGWMVILVAAVVFAGIAVLVGSRSTPTVTATSRLVFSTPEATVGDENQAELVSMQLRTYADIAMSDLVQVGATEQAGISPDDRAAHGVTMTLVPGTRVLQLSVTSRDEATAVALADSTTSQLEAVLQDLERVDDRPAIEAVTNARLMASPGTPHPSRDILLGAAAGVVIGASLVIARGSLTRRRYLTAEDLVDLQANGGDVTAIVDGSASPEAAAVVRSRLLAKPSDHAARTVLVVPTSPSDVDFGELLTSSLAAARYRVAMLDLRTCHGDLGTSDVVEIDDNLTIPLSDLSNGWPHRLSIRFRGSDDALVSPEMISLLQSLSAAFDHVIIATDSAEMSQTAAVVAHLVDEVVVTTTLGVSTPDQLRTALSSLGPNTPRPIEVVGLLG